MNVEIGVEAALFPEKEYISGIFVAVYRLLAPKFQHSLSAVSLGIYLGDLSVALHL